METKLGICFLTLILCQHTMCFVSNEVNKIIKDMKVSEQALNDRNKIKKMNEDSKLFNDPFTILKHIRDMDEDESKVDDTYKPLRNVSLECRRDYQKVIGDAEAGLPYAVKGQDSYGRRPSGLFEYNDKWWGAYDQCRDVRRQIGNKVLFQGKYCMLYVEGLVYGINWGICAPDTCTADEIGILFQYAIIQSNSSLWTTMLGCAKEYPWKTEATISVVIIGILVLLSVCGTAYDTLLRYGFVKPKTTKVPFLNDNFFDDKKYIEIADMLHLFFISFSWITNGQKLLNTSTKSTATASLNGMRVISMSWVVLGHTILLMFSAADNVIPQYNQILDSLSYQSIAYATVSVDSFFYLSGFLVGYLTLMELQKTEGKLNWALYYFHRFWRLTPLYMFILMVYVNLTPYIMNGPLEITWRYSPDMTNCHDDWWTNLLYINNFYANTMSELCMGVAWYLPNDMQFYVISPFIVYMLYRIPIVGLAVCFALLAMDLVASGVVSSEYDISPLIYAVNNQEIVDHLYIRPYYRIAPYIVGMVLAYLLFKKNFRIKLAWPLQIVGWIGATACNMSILFGLYHYHEGETQMDEDLGYFYNAAFRFGWSVGLAWVTLVCCTGYGGPVNALLSWRGWIPLSRLCYGTYLIHLMVLSTYITSTKVPLHSTTFNYAVYFIAMLALSMGVAFITSMLVEAPMMGLEKMIIPTKKTRPQTKETVQNELQKDDVEMVKPAVQSEIKLNQIQSKNINTENHSSYEKTNGAFETEKF